METRVESCLVEVLLVEDSPSDANLTIRVLAQGQIPTRVAWVETGEEALAYLKRQGQFVEAVRPQLIVLDLNLPTMNGQEVLAEIKADDTLKVIPIVIFTTSTDPQDVLHSYQLYANCYITKPFDLQQFTEVVNLIQQFWLNFVRLPLEP